MKKFLSLLLFLLVCSHAFTQNRLSDHNTIGWYSTIITPSFNAKWSGHIEYQWRRTDLVKYWQQSLLRLGVNYKVHPQVTLHVGYAWIETFPYGDYFLAGVPKQFPEHRLYEQVVVSTPVGKANLSHRLRLEQRWIGRLNSLQSTKADEYFFLNRARYMPRLDIPITEKWYASIYDEIFIGFGKKLGENVFDQNRIGIMAGARVNKNFRIEGGYLNQVVHLGREINGQNVFQYNNGIIINTYLNL